MRTSSQILGQILGLFLMISLKVIPAFGQAEANPLRGIAEISSFELVPQKPFILKVQLFLPEGYRAYSDKIKLEIEDPEGFAYKSLKVEPLQTFFDENTKMKKTGIISSATLTAPMEAPSHLSPGEHELKISISYQACTKTYCLFPAKLHVQVPFKFNEEIANIDRPATESPKVFGLGINFEDSLKKGLFWTFLLVFVAGFLTSLTPCIFPIIPITIAVLGRHAHLHSKSKNFLLSLLYVFGIAITYASLGIFAAATGSLFGSFMSHPVVLTAIFVIFVAMALSMFGLFELQAPLWVRKRFGGDLQVHGYHSAFIYGLVAGVVAGPCVGPVLVGILTFVAKTQNIALGFWLLFDFSVGMGVLFIAIGFSSQLTKALPRSGAWMDAVKNFFGVLLLGAAYYYLSLLVNQRIWDAALGLAFIVGGSYFGAFESSLHLKNLGKLKKGFSQAMIFFGAACLTIGAFDLRPFLRNSTNPNSLTESQKLSLAHWIPYSAKDLEQAKADHKPVLIDFGAEWCGACTELDQYTFSKAEFRAMAEKFVLMKYDATNESEELTQLRKRYSILGLPTLLLFDDQGKLRPELTTTEFVEAPILIQKMQKLFN